MPAGRALVRVTLTGFFTLPEVERFARAEQGAVENLGCPPNGHRVLVDASRGTMHSQEVVEAFERMVSASPLRARRIAVVSTGTLRGIQARRILDPARGRLFGTVEEAERWIAEDERAAV